MDATAESLENQRIEAGTKSREALTDRFRLNEDSLKFEQLSVFGREAAHQAVPLLQNTHSPQEFGHILDTQVVSKIKQQFGFTNNEGQEDPNAYGSRAGAAYIERVGTKARDEVSMVLQLKGINTEESRKVLDLLPLASSCEQVGTLLNDLLKNTPEFSSQVDTLFELTKQLKIKEFEDFYERSKASQ